MLNEPGSIASSIVEIHSWLPSLEHGLKLAWATCRRNNRAPFTLVLNLIVPGPPWRNLVMSWAADYSPSSSSGSHSRGPTPKTSVAGRCGHVVQDCSIVRCFFENENCPPFSEVTEVIAEFKNLISMKEHA